MKVKTLWWIVAVLTLVAIALWGNKYQRQLATADVVETAVAATGCDLTKATCNARFSDGSTISLDISPKPIPLLSELQFDVRLSDASMQSDPNNTGIKVSIVGINMEMGFNWTTLHSTSPPLPSTLQKGHYQGKAILPICTKQRMEWQARIFLNTPQGMKTAVFPFHTIKTP